MPDRALPETTIHPTPLPPGLSEGLALVLREEEGGSPSPLAAWLTRYPHLAGQLASFLAAENNLKNDLLAALPASGPVGGGLEVIEKIGRGGMGVVYKARDAMGREVAVKQVQHGADLARFRFEAETVASLNHPNVVPIYSFGEADGRPYLVMPLLKRGSLAEWLKELGPDRLLAPKKAAALVRDIARGAYHAHQRGVIHRDLKPGNVLLADDGTPMITDFGLARRVGGEGMTQTGEILGTLEYMAPEQARGEIPTTAVDVYALGVILFELLTGRTPFGGEDLPSTLRRAQEELAPLVRKLRPDVPADLEEVCRRCLQKDPRERYASAQELADDLTRFLNGEPVGPSRRSTVLGLIAREMGWRRETAAMPSWTTMFWGAASTLAAMIALQAAVLLAAPLWVSWAAMAWYLAGWAGILWVFLVDQRDRLNPVERASTILTLGQKLACAAILPAVAWLHGGDVVPALASFVVIIGLGIFAHGTIYWGQLYLLGATFFIFAALMPLVPLRYWPTAYGAFLVAVQVLIGLHLRRVHYQAAG